MSEKQSDWTEEAEWNKAPPVRTREDDRANELLQAGFMMGLLRQLLTDNSNDPISARVFLGALRPEVAEILVSRGKLVLPKVVEREWEKIKRHDSLPVT